ncbi:MAG: NAD(P)-dependent oxidoreductase [Anaerolineae bacterium]
MIAHSLAPYRDLAPDAVIFASGVANSLTVEPGEYSRECVLLTDVLRECRQQDRRIVYFSSGGAIYGTTSALRSETTPTTPMTIYGQHKLACETLIVDSGVPYLILRLANLVGHVQNASQLVPALIRQAKHGHLRLFTHATRDLLDVEDFANLLVLLLEAHSGSDLVTVASGQSIPVTQIAQTICDLLALQPEFERNDGGDEQRFDTSKLQRILPGSAHFAADYYRSVLEKYVADIPGD